MATTEVFHDERTADSADSGTVPPDLPTGGRVVDARGERNDAPVSYRIPDRTIVPSLDEGPDPTWPPKLLDILKDRGVHASLFIPGSTAAQHPDIVRRMVDEGHEIGPHTVTRPDLALLRDGWRIVYAGKARARTQAPAGMGGRWSQRYRWSYGTVQAMWKHPHTLVEPGPGGRFGRLGLPMVVLFGVLAPLLAPVIDRFLLHGVLFVDAQKTLAAWFGVLAVQGLLASYAFRLDRERPWHPITLPVQQMVYRQPMYPVLLQSSITAVTGGRLRWQKLRRTGEVSAPIVEV
ncbi:bifunctional polysaccharide deacetylase/glycosyltransferase family 2 protein [Kitasatospora sp. DSM 101779]|uniref:bifunctional polysaccharide deacetylase/glycosyltransferase family 2 protein n=1 Tax=Kitasatospora sp. DSM 101779 TaxID=2853165 RepID=UPI0039884F46